MSACICGKHMHMRDCSRGCSGNRKGIADRDVTMLSHPRGRQGHSAAGEQAHGCQRCAQSGRPGALQVCAQTVSAQWRLLPGQEPCSVHRRYV